MGELKVPPIEYWKKEKPDRAADRAVEEFKIATGVSTEKVIPIAQSLKKEVGELRQRKRECDSRIVEILESLSDMSRLAIKTQGEDRKNTEDEIEKLEQERARLAEESAALEGQIIEVQNKISRLETHALDVEEGIQI